MCRCAERRDALAEAARRVRTGDTAAALQAARTVGRSLAEDARRLALAMGRRR